MVLKSVNWWKGSEVIIFFGPVTFFGFIPTLVDDYYTKTRHGVGHARVEVLSFNMNTSLLAATKTKLQSVQRWRKCVCIGPTNI